MSPYGVQDLLVIYVYKYTAFPIAFSIASSNAFLRGLKENFKIIILQSIGRDEVRGKYLIHFEVVYTRFRFLLYFWANIPKGHVHLSFGLCLPKGPVLLIMLLKTLGSIPWCPTPISGEYVMNINTAIRRYLLINRRSCEKVTASVGYKQCVNTFIYSTRASFEPQEVCLVENSLLELLRVGQLLLLAMQSPQKNHLLFECRQHQRTSHQIRRTNTNEEFFDPYPVVPYVLS